MRRNLEGGGGVPLIIILALKMGQKLFSVTPSPLFIFASNVNDGKNVNVINVL